MTVPAGRTKSGKAAACPPMSGDQVRPNHHSDLACNISISHANAGHHGMHCFIGRHVSAAVRMSRSKLRTGARQIQRAVRSSCALAAGPTSTTVRRSDSEEPLSNNLSPGAFLLPREGGRSSWDTPSQRQDLGEETGRQRIDCH